METSLKCSLGLIPSEHNSADFAGEEKFIKDFQEHNFIVDTKENASSVAYDHEEEGLGLLATAAITAGAINGTASTNIKQRKRKSRNEQMNGSSLPTFLSSIDYDNTGGVDNLKSTITKSEGRYGRPCEGILMRRKRSKKIATQLMFAEVGLPFAPKGISKTNSGNWRLQMKLGREKRLYSRNLASLEEALWFYELKVLISDEPNFINIMITLGNYDALVRLNCCTSVDDYANKLMNKLEEYAAGHNSKKEPDFSLEDIDIAKRTLYVMQVNATILKAEQEMGQST